MTSARYDNGEVRGPKRAKASEWEAEPTAGAYRGHPIGDHPRRCQATVRRTGQRCQQWAAPGLTVCKFHGAAAPRARAKATRTVVETEARSVLQRLGQPDPIDHPVIELLRVAAEAKAWQTILRELVDQHRQLVTTDVMGIERERAVIALYERALDRNARLLEGLARLDLAGRLVRVKEAEAAAIVAVLEGAVRRLGLDPADLDIRSALAAELEAVEPEVVP